MNGKHPPQERKRSRLATAFWLAVALALCLSVAVINRTPNLYFDTGLYLDVGHRTLEIIGATQTPEAASPGATVANSAPESTPDSAPDSAAEEDEDGTTSGSRSAVFAVFLSAMHMFADLRLVPLVQAVALVSTFLISTRTIVRRYGLRPSPASLTAIAAAGAALGSAPFYVAFLMPDIFAPILVLAMAGFAGFTDDMRPLERLGLYALAVIAVLSHPSHLAMALVLVPPVLLAIFLFGMPRRWFASLLILAIPAAGLLEHVSFRTAVKTVTHSEVIYTPFMTARLIVDGPGLTYLRSVCPDPEVATCALMPMLEEPQRVTPYNILFEKDTELGSLALLPQEMQRAIMAEQVEFAKNVVLTHPFGVARALIRNTLVQLSKHSVQTTLMRPEQAQEIRASAFDIPGYFDNARLRPNQSWAVPLNAMHGVVYALSGFILVALTLWPGSGLPRQLRCWSLILLLGILANAFVCGAVSQPAARYGARILFLLPMAVLLLASIRLFPPVQAAFRRSDPKHRGDAPGHF